MADRPDCWTTRLAVTRAIFRDAGLKGYSTATRAEIMEAAKVSLSSLADALAWLREIGEIGVEKDLNVRSRRRLVLLIRPPISDFQDPATHKRLGRRRTTPCVSQDNPMGSPGQPHAAPRRASLLKRKRVKKS